MVRSGFQRWLPDGLRIVTDTGHGLSHGAGRGLTMPPGDLLPATMDAGYTPAASGDGLPVRSSWLVRFMHLRWSPGLVARTLVSVSPLAAEPAWAGSRWDGVNPTFPRIP